MKVSKRVDFVGSELLVEPEFQLTIIVYDSRRIRTAYYSPDVLIIAEWYQVVTIFS